MDMREFADSRLAAVCRDEIEEQPSPEGILLVYQLSLFPLLMKPKPSKVDN